MPRAVVVASGPGTLEIVGGLPLAVRTVLALRASGCSDIAVLARGERGPIETILTRRGVAVRWLSGPADLGRAPDPAPVSILPGDVLVDARGVARAPVCPATALPALLGELSAGRPLAEALAGIGGAHGPGPGEGLYVPLDGAHPPAVLEAFLMASFGRHTAAADSYMAGLIDRRLSRPLTRLLLNRAPSPSQITLASLLVGLSGAASLTTTSHAGRLVGVFLLVASSVLDCVDGEVARARFEQSAAGARLDVIGDYLVHFAVFVGLGVGLIRQGVPAAGWATLALVGGVGASMVAAHALFVRPALSGGGDLHWHGDGRGLKGTPVAAAAEKLASRDYIYLLLILALIDRLEWFLFAAAAGSWLFAAGLCACWGLGAAGGQRVRSSR